MRTMVPTLITFACQSDRHSPCETGRHETRQMMYCSQSVATERKLKSNGPVGVSMPTKVLAILLSAFRSPPVGWQSTGQAGIIAVKNSMLCPSPPGPHRATVLQYDIPSSGPEHGDLTESADQKLSRRHLLSAFGLAAGAILLFSNVDEARATEEMVEPRNSLHRILPVSTSPETSVVLAANAEAMTSAAPGADLGAILLKSAKKAVGGGTAGASAAIVQVLSLMWLRTAMTYQYRYGGDLVSALRTLFDEGGVVRLYQGLPFALVLAPLIKFGDTASNIGALALLDGIPAVAELPLPIRSSMGSIIGSGVAGLWRVLCMPVDTSKVALQVEGELGWERLKQRVVEQGLGPLYQGWLVSASASFAGNAVWFLTYNYFDESLPLVTEGEVLLSLLRSAFLGFSASSVAEVASNSLKVIKTTQQTAGLKSPDLSLDQQPDTAFDQSSSTMDMPLVTQSDMDVDLESKSDLSIKEAFALVLENDGIQGLLFRGLTTRLLLNAIQGAVFSVLWKYFQASGDNR